MSADHPLGPDAVFDCNFYLRAVTGTSGPAYECLQLLGTSAYTSLVSRDVLEEVAEVLSRPILQHKFPALTPESVRQLIDTIKTAAILIHNVPETFRYRRDPNDEIYINLALVTNAQYLVTYDKDLLDLMADTEEGRKFRHRFPGLKILDPQTFLRALQVTHAS